MLPHLNPKTPGTQKSTQNLKIMVIFGVLVKASLNLKTDHKFELEDGFNQRQIFGYWCHTYIQKYQEHKNKPQISNLQQFLWFCLSLA